MSTNPPLVPIAFELRFPHYVGRIVPNLDGYTADMFLIYSHREILVSRTRVTTIREAELWVRAIHEELTSKELTHE